MLICIVLCAAAVLPTAFSNNAQVNGMTEGSVLDNLVSSRNLGNSRLMVQMNDDDQLPSEIDDIVSVFYPQWATLNYPLLSSLLMERQNPFLKSLAKALDQMEDGHALRRDTVLDSIGGGHLLRRYASLDPIGGGHLLKRSNAFRALDSIGGGHLLKRNDGFGQLDSIGGGHLLKRDPLDSIGGGHLLKRGFGPRHLDSIGGGHLLRRSLNSGEQPSESYNV